MICHISSFFFFFHLSPDGSILLGNLYWPTTVIILLFSVLIYTYTHMNIPRHTRKHMYILRIFSHHSFIKISSYHLQYSISCFSHPVLLFFQSLLYMSAYVMKCIYIYIYDGGQSMVPTFM